MKRATILLALLLCMLTATCALAQTDTVEKLAQTDLNNPVERMIWNADGSVLTLVTSDHVERYYAGGSAPEEKFAPEADDRFYISASGDGLTALISTDRQMIFLYEPGSAAKDLLTIEPGFMALAVSLSEDGTKLLVDSADEIRTVIYKTADGSILFDLNGFRTGAPVYDSTISRDGEYVVWHARGTFAVQNTSDGSFGETISLWDFASSYDLSPDSRTLAVGIINEDYENAVVIFFDPESGTEKGRTNLNQFSCSGLSWSTDGSMLWAADNGSVYCIDGKSFTVIAQADLFQKDAEERILRVAAAPDGNSAAVLTSEGNIFLVR